VSEDIRLIAITDPSLHPGRDVVEVCRAAEAGGATSVQLRWKGASAADLLRTTERLIAGLGIPVYVNDRLDVALVAGAAGAHLGADDFPPDRIRQMAPRPLRIGVSVGTETEARDARQADADYWSIGPFHPTATKADAGSALGPQGFRSLARVAPPGMPVVAIGGLTVGTVPSAIRAGAAGVAVISAIFAAPDIAGATRALRDAIDTAMG
jgi:thiamine-phosphate pyrophosphorylase